MSKTEEQSGQLTSDDSDLEKYSKKLKEKCLIDSEQEYSEDDSEAMEENAGKLGESSEVDSDYDSATDDQNECESRTIPGQANQSSDIQNQLRMWEKLLPIQSQKILPGPAYFNEFCGGTEGLSTLARETKRNVDKNVERFPGNKNFLKQSKKRKLRTNDEEPDIKRFANVIQGNSESFRSYCNKSSDSDDGSGRASVTNSQAKRARSVSCGGDINFDHQQLQELVGFKTKTSSITELQKLQQKIKKKSCIRASTRRKRRQVRNKMLNFMGPNPHKTDESSTKLNRSLFGT